jgi:chromosome segregation ATPase
MRLAKWVLCGAGLLVLGFGASTAAQTGKTQETEILPALLVEVRGLRQAMEQIGTSGARVQLSLGRLQLQETRVNNMIRRLESIRDSIAKAEKEHAQTAAQLANFEGMFKQNAKDIPPGEKNPMEAMLDGFRKGVEGGAADILRLQTEEAQIQQQIAAEQGRWAEINKALEELERSLKR